MHKGKTAEILLKEKGLRKTNQRIELLNVFISLEDSLSSNEIEKELGNPDRITVYRTLKSFVDCGLIHEINISGRESRYALCQDSCSNHEHVHNHIHLECTNCKTISCVDILNYPKIKVPGVFISEVAINAKGLCEKCSETKVG